MSHEGGPETRPNSRFCRRPQGSCNVNRFGETQTLQIALKGPLATAQAVALWCSSADKVFEKLPRVPIKAGVLTLVMKPDTICTATTRLSSGLKGAHPPSPPSARQPKTHHDDFSEYTVDTLARGWSDVYGSFAVRPSGGGRMALTQVATAKPTGWAPTNLDPLTFFGDSMWGDVTINATAMINGTAAGAGARATDPPPPPVQPPYVRLCGGCGDTSRRGLSYGCGDDPTGKGGGCCFKLSRDGSWSLGAKGKGGASGTIRGFVDTWHKLGLAIEDGAISASVDGVQLGEVAGSCPQLAQNRAPGFPGKGMVGIGCGSTPYHMCQVDEVSIDARGAASRAPPIKSDDLQQPQCDRHTPASPSPPIGDTCSVLPTGNDCRSGSCDTASAFAVQGTTSHAEKREFLVTLGLTSDHGQRELGPQQRPNIHDKVTLYAGIVGKNGTGDIWSFNPLLTQAPGSGSYNAQCIELDLNNMNAHRGDADAGAGLAEPVTYGWSVTGAGNFRSTAAIGVMGQKGMWNRGIVFAADSIAQSAFQDLGASHQKSIDIRGSPVYGVYQASPQTKNLFNGNTTHRGELRLRGQAQLVVERGGKERSVVLSASATEEVASSGVAALGDHGAVVVSLGAELCESGREHSYQLTAVGRPMPNLHVVRELSASEEGGCAFAVGGAGEGGGRVSWRVHSRQV